MDKYEVAQILREMAFLIELTDENPKKSIAYRKAANSIESSENFDDLIKKNALEDIPGVGQKISKMIISLVERNKLAYYELLKNNVPSGILELVNVGLNAKKIRELYEKFKIRSLNELQNALEQKAIIGIKGFSPFFLEKLKKRLERYLAEGNFLLYSKANHIADILKNKLREVTTKIEISGALRRKCEMINEIIFVVTTKNSENCRLLFLNHGFVQHILNDNAFFFKVLLIQGVSA
jgi:DNA polymerase (family 10)